MNINGDAASFPTELAEQFSHVRRGRSTTEIARGTNLSRETICKIERGQTVKLVTLKALATFLNASGESWMNLLAAWLKIEAGDDAKGMRIEPMGNDGTALARPLPADPYWWADLYESCNLWQRQELMKAMGRPSLLT